MGCQRSAVGCLIEDRKSTWKKGNNSEINTKQNKKKKKKNCHKSAAYPHSPLFQNRYHVIEKKNIYIYHGSASTG